MRDRRSDLDAQEAGNTNEETEYALRRRVFSSVAMTTRSTSSSP